MRMCVRFSIGKALIGVSALLSKQVDRDNPCRLPSEMNIDDPDLARALLDPMLRGLLTNGHS
jgi:hypothetical protein